LRLIQEAIIRLCGLDLFPIDTKEGYVAGVCIFFFFQFLLFYNGKDQIY